jgi:hypothetical protein
MQSSKYTQYMKISSPRREFFSCCSLNSGWAFREMLAMFGNCICGDCWQADKDAMSIGVKLASNFSFVIFNIAVGCESLVGGIVIIITIVGIRGLVQISAGQTGCWWILNLNYGS